MTLAPRREVRRAEAVPERTVLGAADDASRRERRPRNVSKLTPLAALRSSAAKPRFASAAPRT